MKKLIKNLAISEYFSALLVACVLSVSVSASASAQDKADKVYSGVYVLGDNSYQIIPNTMATLCQITGNEVVENPLKLKECIDSLIIKRRSSDTEVAREGIKDLNLIKADQIAEMLSLSAIRGAEIADYYTETSQKTDEINADAKTVNDVDGASVNTNQLLATVINSFRDIYVEQLKYLAISNIEDIDRNVLDNMGVSENNKEEKEEKEDKKVEVEPVAEVTTVEAKEVVGTNSADKGETQQQSTSEDGQPTNTDSSQQQKNGFLRRNESSQTNQQGRQENSFLKRK